MNAPQLKPVRRRTRRRWRKNPYARTMSKTNRLHKHDLQAYEATMTPGLPWELMAEIFQWCPDRAFEVGGSSFLKLVCQKIVETTKTQKPKNVNVLVWWMTRLRSKSPKAVAILKKLFNRKNCFVYLSDILFVESYMKGRGKPSADEEEAWESVWCCCRFNRLTDKQRSLLCYASDHQALVPGWKYLHGNITYIDDMIKTWRRANQERFEIDANWDMIQNMSDDDMW